VAIPPACEQGALSYLHLAMRLMNSLSMIKLLPSMDYKPFGVAALSFPDAVLPNET